MWRLLFLFFLLASCSHRGIVQQGAIESAAPEWPKKINSSAISVAPEPEKQDLRVSLSAVKKPIFSLKYKKKHYQFWIQYFSGKNRERFLRHLRNGDKYRDIVHGILRRHGLPKDLFYVGLIESGFNTHIRSWASAVGPWQFIRGTGKRYKLRIDRHMDERRSIYKATEAAAQYFKDLYNIFGSWELALCAYNAGEYRVINAIRKGNTRDYKKLVSQRLIPKETIYYVPKVAAARHLAQKWKLERDQKAQAFYREVVPIKIKRPLNVARMARHLGIPWKVLKKLNPDLNSIWVHPRRHRPVKLYIPKHRKSLVAAWAAGLTPITKVKGVAEIEKAVAPSFVRRRATVKRAVAKTSARRAKRRRGRKSRKKFRPSIFYRVKKGENLTRIASRLGVSLKKLKKRNNLRSGKIFVGQKLLNPSVKRAFYYVVKRGDSLARIAQRFGVSLGHLLRHNRIKSKIIYPGRKIRIPPI